MNIRIFSAVLLAAVSASCSAQTLTFKNKSDVPVRIVAGSSATPAFDNPYVMSSPKTMLVKPGKEGELSDVVENDESPQIMFWQEGKPEVAYIYEFDAETSGKKKLVVQLTNDMKFTSVPFTLNTITKKDIISKGVVDLKAKRTQFTGGSSNTNSGSKTTPLTPRQKEALQVLGFAPDATPSESEIKRVYKQLSLANHPDKVPAAQRAQANEKQKAINSARDLLISSGSSSRG